MNYSESLRKLLFAQIHAASLDRNNFRNSDTDFTRNRKLSFSDTFKIILSMGGNSIANELLDHFDFAYRHPTSSAFVQSRDKILPIAFESVFRSFTNCLDNKFKFNGYRLLAIDGTNLNLFRDPNDEDTFISNITHNGHNSMHLSAIYDLLNHIYTDAVVQPAKLKDERGALIDMIPNLPSKTILIADRGYESYNLFAHIENINSHYLFRVKDIHSNGILSGFDLPDEEFDKELIVNISNKQWKELKNIDNFRFSPSIARFDFSDDENPVYTLKFRTIRIKLSNGKYESIISNLPIEFSASDIERMYFLRWGIETSFRQLKYAIGLANLHAKKKDSVKQEIYAKLILYNFCEAIVQNLVLIEKNTKHTYKINFTRAIKVCRKYLRSQMTVSLNIEALISKFLSIVRQDRAYKRSIKRKGFTSFVYRIS